MNAETRIPPFVMALTLASRVSLLLWLRLAGLGLIALSLFHAVLWRSLGWGRVRAALAADRSSIRGSSLLHRVRALRVGLALADDPELLLACSELARLLVAAIVLFWLAR